MSSIFVKFLKMWYQNIQKSKHKQRKIKIKILKSVLAYFWVNFGAKNDQKSPNSEFGGVGARVIPLKIIPKINFVILFIKYKI